MVLQTGEQGLVRARREPKYKAKKVYLRNHNMCFFHVFAQNTQDERGRTATNSVEETAVSAMPSSIPSSNSGKSAVADASVVAPAATVNASTSGSVCRRYGCTRRPELHGEL